MSKIVRSSEDHLCEACKCNLKINFVYRYRRIEGSFPPGVREAKDLDHRSVGFLCPVCWDIRKKERDILYEAKIIREKKRAQERIDIENKKTVEVVYQNGEREIIQKVKECRYIKGWMNLEDRDGNKWGICTFKIAAHHNNFDKIDKELSVFDRLSYSSGIRSIEI